MKTKTKRGKSNPNGVNQYTAPDPRQTFFLSYYLDPKSSTFSNGLQSALKAGYTQEYAENLLAKMPDWLSDNIGKLNLLSKAERNLNSMLDLDEESEGRLRVKADITKFVASSLGKGSYGGGEDKASTVTNFTQIIINGQNTGNKSNPEAVVSVAGITKS